MATSPASGAGPSRSTDPNICLIYTGGTLGMRSSPRGYVPAAGLGQLLAEKLPELATAVRYDIVEPSPPLDSANATPRNWYALAETLASLMPRYDGFVVVHGTDTLAYTASALSFLLASQPRPVIVTGSQIPLAEVRNDARGNLVAAMQVAAAGRVREVAVCFGPSVLRGNRTTKVRATALDAFTSPNCPPLARIGTEIRYGEELEPLPSANGLSYTGYRPVSISVLPLVPGLPASVVDTLAQSGVQAVILECYGIGTSPDRDDALMAALARLIGADVVVVAISQCLEGGVALGTYATGQALSDMGVISGADMTREAAYTKLHALFAQGLAPQNVARLMQQDLRGELTPVAG